MSFSVYRIGSPAAVAAKLREDGKKNVENVAQPYHNTILTIFEAAAMTAESVSGPYYDGLPRGVVAKVSGHVGSDGGCNVTMTVEPSGMADIAAE